MEKLKQLREKTGAGMVACKKALVESGGDINKAVEILRKKGIAKAAKREGREAGEGIIKLAINQDATEGYIIKLTSETDFVARNEKFQAFAEQVLELVKAKKPESKEELLGLTLETGTVKDELSNLSGTIGEKMEIAGFGFIKSKGTVAAYSHMGGRIGVLVSLDKKGSEELAYDIAMHIAAADPKYIRTEDVGEDEIKKEKEIYTEQLLKEGKPKNIIEKILVGKINKYFEEVVLLKQEYIKDDKKKIEEILGDVQVEKFIRYNLQ